MKRTSNTFTVLQATAAIVGLAILLWSLGLPSFHFVEAANVTTISDTLSDSGPSVVANHTIEFTTPTGVAAGETIIVTFPDGASDFDLSFIGAEDIDLASTTGDYSLSNTGASGETWGVSTSTFSITLTSGTAVLTANATVTIEIGTNATFEAGTQTQILNPTAASYEINVAAGSADTGATRVAIVPTVNVTASVDTLFTFTVAGVAAGETVNVADTTDGPTTATTIPFGELSDGNASTTAQLLSVNTNAKNGFVVTVTADGQLDSTTGADIDGFRNGNFDSTPVAWEAPTPSISDEDTWGHWGLTSDDGTLTSGLTDPFLALGAGDRFVSASTTPVEVFRHDGPTNGVGQGVGTTTVGYKVEISALQEAADDYTATLTYVATPVF